MKQSQIKSLRYILESEDKKRRNQPRKTLPKVIDDEQLLDYWLAFKNQYEDNDTLIRKIYQVWERDYLNAKYKDEKKAKKHELVEYWTKSLAYNQIIEFIKGQERKYCVFVWYFEEDDRPFFVERAKMNQLDKIKENDDSLKTLINQYDCNYKVLKEDITEVEALKIKKQLIYHFLASGLNIINV